MRPTPLERLRALLGLKLRMTAGLLLAVSIGYFGLQRLRLRPPLEVAGSWFELGLDRAVPFEPRWTWVYLSLYLFMPLFPWLTEGRRLLLRYARGFAAVAGVSFLLFVLVPVDSPRPSALPDHTLYRLLVAVEGPGNAFPSLHAGLATYSWLYGRKLLASERWVWPRVILVVAALWVTLILVSTLLTRQHWTLDLAAGAVVGWAGHRWAFRGSTFGGGDR